MQAVIAHRAALLKSAGREETQRAEPVIDGDHHHLLLAGQRGGVKVAARARLVAAAVNPDHHGQLPRTLRRIHVQVQAVFCAAQFFFSPHWL